MTDRETFQSMFGEMLNNPEFRTYIKQIVNEWRPTAESSSLPQNLAQQIGAAIRETQGQWDIKVGEPDEYKGDQTKTQLFLLHLKNVFAAQANKFSDRKLRVWYAVSFLKDIALTWIVPFLEMADSDPRRKFLDTFNDGLINEQGIEIQENFTWRLRLMFNDPNYA